MPYNRLTVRRGDGELVLAQPYSPWLRWRLPCCYGPRWWHEHNSCCCSTGHGAVIYRVISPSRWRSGTVVSYKSMPHAQNVGAPYAHSCFWAHAYNPPTATQCPTLSARVTRQRWKHWRNRLSGAIRRVGEGVCLRQSGAVHCGAVGQPACSSMALPTKNLIISLHLKRVQSVEGNIPVGAFRHFRLSQNMAGRSKMKQVVLVSIKPTVAIIVSNSGTPSTDCAELGICAATHSSRKAARRRTKNSTISIMDMIMIMMNRTRKKMTRWVIDI